MNTRLAPTPNGHLHLGHVCMALVNEYQALTTSRGKFILRFEDDQPDWVQLLGDKQIEYMTEAVEMLAWLGIVPNEIQRQSFLMPEIKHWCKQHGHVIPAYRPTPFPMPLDPTLGSYSADFSPWYSYTPRFTFIKVVADHLDGIHDLIRGSDLLPEFGSYQRYAEEIGADVTHYYLPRLLASDGEILGKRTKAPGVIEYKRAGWKPERLLQLLAKSFLKDPAAGWSMYNVKREPRLEKELESIR